MVKFKSGVPDCDGFITSTNEKKYYFKIKDNNRLFKELLAQEVAELLGIPHITYYPYSTKKCSGVISESFIKDGFSYMSGIELLEDYIAKTNRKNREYLYDCTTGGCISYKSYQDLYIIWQAVEQKFKHYPNYDYLIISFMDKLIKMVLFDLLIVNWDRYSRNWFIEYNNSEFRLVDALDHDFSFDSNFDSALGITQYDINNDKSLINLIKETDGCILKYFNDMCDKCNPDNIKKIIDMTIEKQKIIVSEVTINEVTQNFKNNYYSLMDALKELKGNKENKTKRYRTY